MSVVERSARRISNESIQLSGGLCVEKSWSENFLFPFEKPRRLPKELIETLEKGDALTYSDVDSCSRGISITAGVLYPVSKAFSRGQPGDTMSIQKIVSTLLQKKRSKSFKKRAQRVRL
jgi:hypothetical protein